MTARTPPRTLWVVLCRDVEFLSRSNARDYARTLNENDALAAARWHRPRRRYWVEAYDRRRAGMR